MNLLLILCVNECAELLERMQTNYNDAKTTDTQVVNKISADEEEVEEECVEVEEIEYKGRSYLLSEDNNVYNDRRLGRNVEGGSYCVCIKD